MNGFGLNGFFSRLIKPAVFIGASLPFLWLIAGAFGLFGQSLGPNPVREMLHTSGKTALNLLMITLMSTPLRVISGNILWQKPRRMLGLFAFAYALLHFVIYAVLELELDVNDLGRELTRRPFIIVGTIALLALLPLAATSTDRMMRRLGKRWQRLHSLIYPITILAIWHYYWQVKADVREPLIYAGVLAVLLGWRLWVRRRPLTQRPSAARSASRD